MKASKRYNKHQATLRAFALHPYRNEARQIFNAAIANETDADRIATVELLREYFTNPEFRTGLETCVAKINEI